MVEAAGLFHRVFDDFLDAGSLGQLAHGESVRAALDELFDLKMDLIQINVAVPEHVGGDSVSLFNQPEQHVFGADVLVIEPLGLLIGQLLWWAVAHPTWSYRP